MAERGGGGGRGEGEGGGGWIDLLSGKLTDTN